jgi:hypothetical protein
MSLTYTTYVATMANLLVVPPTNAEFVQILPAMIDDAEQRLYRDLDLLSTVVRDSSGTLTANSRNFTLPQANGRFVVTNNLNVFTPVGTTANRRQLVPVSRDWLDAVWGNDAAPSLVSVPSYYAMITDQTVIVGPAPDAGYTVEVIGTIRPTPLSAGNVTTYLTQYLPDLFVAASMVFAAGYQQNFSAMADSPQQGASWEAHYKNLFGGANIEENRKRYASQAWTSMQPAPFATPPRA